MVNLKPILFASLFLTAPFAVGIPSDWPDATVAGPAGFVHKSFAGIGYGGCQSEITGGPLNCGAPPGTIESFGMTKIPTTTCDPFNHCVVDIWSIQTGGAEVTGWAMVVGNDRDDTGFAENIAASDDDLASAYVGTVLAGDEKDWKGQYAHLRFCIRDDIPTAGGGFDDIFVAIINWVDENVVFGDNTGIGVGAGTFDIHVEGFYAALCSPEGDILWMN